MSVARPPGISLRRAVATATAPGKVILFGEHAINRGQPALATAVGRFARCGVRPASDSSRWVFRSQDRVQSLPPDVLRETAEQLEDARRAGDFERLRSVARGDYFAPQKYVLAGIFGDAWPDALEIEWQSELPSSSGLGSGGAAFTAMVAAVAALLPETPTLDQRAAWAHRGDVIAHGGIASALDTQTSLLGGVIRFTGQGLADAVPCAPRLSIVVGNTGVQAATGEVNGRVRAWLAERPASRMAYFQTVGTLSRAALPLLARGDWPELGRLMNLNQLVLEKIGVSCTEIDRLIDAALGAGALGAKISGSGGGGIIIALVTPETRQAVADAIERAGGSALVPEVSVPGVRVERSDL